MTKCNTSGLNFLEKRQQKHKGISEHLYILFTYVTFCIKSHPFRDDIIKSESAPTVMYCITACLTNIHRRRTHQHYPPVTLSTTVCLYKVGKESKS